MKAVVENERTIMISENSLIFSVFIVISQIKNNLIEQ